MPFKEGVLWIGGLADYMTEKFLKDGFTSLGETDVERVEIVKNKFTGKPAGYGLVYFDTDASALMAMHKLNNKTIPNSQPPIRFQLNHSSAQASGNNPFSQREFSIWVTDLPQDCSDDLLRKTFSTRYESVKTASVQVDSSHGRKPYGFVRFTDQEDQRDALIHMNGFTRMGDGEKPIKVSMAIPKKKPGGGTEDESAGSKNTGQYSYYYESYWADNAAWGNYAKLAPGGKHFIQHAMNNAGNTDVYHAPHNDDWLEDEEDENRFIEWDVPVNIDAMNKELMERSLDTWDGIERDRWLYSFQTEDSIIPDFDKPSDKWFKKRTDLEDQLFKDLGADGNEDEEDDIQLVGSLF